MRWGLTLGFRFLPLALALLPLGCSTSRAGAFLIAHPLRIPVVGAPLRAHEDIHFKTDDGLTLRGWLFRPPSTPRGLVVLLHGKDINRQHLSTEVGRFVDRGFAVFMYDHRAHGASDGSQLTYGYREAPDLQRGLDAVGIAPAYVIGESLGAAVALQGAARDSRIRGVVAGASFAELSTIIMELSPLSEAATRKSIAEAEREWGFSVEEVAPARAAKDIHVPVLLLHGTEDTLITPAHSRRIYANLAGPKRLVLLDGVGHQGVLLHDEAWQVVTDWLEGVARTVAEQGTPAPN